MAEKILVIGESGSGKSTSTKNLNEKETFYINCVGKNLPFRGWKAKYTYATKETPKGNMLKTTNFQEVIKMMKYVSEKMPHVKTLIIDDAQYIMTYEFMDRAMEKGYDKFSELAQHYFEVLRTPDFLRPDLTVIFFSHSQDEGQRTKIKTIGKMLDEKLTIEGMFTMVLLATCYKDIDKTIKHVFVTRNNGLTTVKTPDGMFSEPTIPNDLQFVLDKVEEYNNG